jgi:hypothetical protein
MLNKKIMLAGAAALAFALTGCATSPAPRSTDPLLGSVQLAADGLAAQLHRYRVDAPIIVASAQNNDQLSQVCPHGRLVSDIVSSRLTQAGFPVTEVRLTSALRINQEGETILSRELGALAKAAKAELVVTATWSTLNGGATVKFANAYGALESTSKGGQTYVTLKAVRLVDGLVVSSQTFAPPTSWSCN